MCYYKSGSQETLSHLARGRHTLQRLHFKSLGFISSLHGSFSREFAFVVKFAARINSGRIPTYRSTRRKNHSHAPIVGSQSLIYLRTICSGVFLPSRCHSRDLSDDSQESENLLILDQVMTVSLVESVEDDKSAI